MSVPKKNQLVGLDIGSQAIKLVEIDHSKKGRILKNIGIIRLPIGAIVEGTIKETEIVSSAIKTLYRNLKIKNKDVAASISGYSVIVKKVQMSDRSASELEETIQSEAEQYIPFDINDVNLDYDILGVDDQIGQDKEAEKEKPPAGQMEVMLVAAKKEIVEDYVTLIQLSGLNPTILDVDAFALQNAFEVNADEPEGCFALINVGAEELGINAIKNGVSIFSRDSFYGGNQISEGIMSAFDVDFEEAEKIKLGGKKVDSDKTALESIFNSVVPEWAQEIKRALDFLASTYPDENIEKIVLSGGSSKVPGFSKFLELETGIPVENLNPFANLIVNEKAFDSKYLSHIAAQAGVAVGLALRSIGDK